LKDIPKLGKLLYVIKGETNVGVELSDPKVLLQNLINGAFFAF
jgi:hypothetical protein